MTLNLVHYTDPSHGWLEVPLSIMRELRVTGSSFSYIRGEKVYLEQDSDAGKFVRAAEAAGYTLEVRDHHTDEQSQVRTFHQLSYAYSDVRL